MKTATPQTTNVYGAELSRRGFLRTGGALVVGFCLLKADSGQAATSNNTLNPALPESWIEIHADNTVLIRTGKCDFGQSSIYTAYRQIVADELDVPFEAITTVVSGDTDRTPEGGGTFDLLGRGVVNLRKAAAYTRQAITRTGVAAFRRRQGSDLHPGRDGFRRRQEHDLRRTGQGSEPETHDSHDRRSDLNVRPGCERQSAAETGRAAIR